ncbi:response regulator transcription factor [Burkholderia stagnalis]|uniref:response regulator transcription factor n=1 Tax=Burkholderia stagnalis TaxID=1503054 RepID=UPI000F5E7E30|nr:response regulator transcription factor [Burkholderia stagnalis]RQX85394.1 DNA-binding response regulator [Burkholderia stagnalis]RQY27909.1 DNA-binding response regulator [Burkholderia stagnalis]
MRVLWVDGDGADGFISSVLQEHGCEVTVAQGGERAVRLLQQAMFDLVILAWVMPNGSASNVLHWIRTNLGQRVPVAVMANDSTENSVAEALNAGADDFIKKSIGRIELIARVNALARRTLHSRENSLSIHVRGYFVPATGSCVYVNGNAVRLTKKEMDIVVLLFRNIGRIVPREHLVEAVWGQGGGAVSRSLDTHVYRVRNKLKLNNENGLMLRSIFSVGYRLENY